ncbi:MAG: DNA ligase (NAD(+)) LigA [Myxococcales bacterium 68-20]|nr:NAD-dependent DNA ligase LigA [Myxococcales bacterium]OJY17504.1 MAG: DNA ligase (NAD(+)) LigA [Myxococcales bacterium 68-20]
MGTSSSSADRVAELAELLRKYKDAYYNGQALVSDAAYDALEDELRALEPEHAILKSVGAPVNEVVTEWEKARHAIPMGSLNKAVNEAEFRQWVARCDQLGVESALVPIANDLLVTEKLDGLSLAVNYENGKLVEAITRGDGQVGERITSNARRMKGVPARLPEPLTVSIRGEIILKLSDMKIGFPGTDAPPRNRAAGTSKRFDGAGCEHLTVMFYDLEGGDTEHATEKEKYERLLQLGLIVPPFEVTDLEGALRIHNEYSSKKRAELDYEIDGLVVRANDLRAQHLLGELGGRPRAAVAYKFASLAKVSRVIAINWETGPTGRVTPIANVEPVEIGGATVQFVVLHNVSNVERLGIGVGHEVLVSRRNDVIPHLEEVVVKHGPSVAIPSACATCDAALGRRGEYLVCTNLQCRAIVEGRIRRWVGTQDILELGDKLIAQLVEAQLVREPADLYRLTIDDIAGLERRGATIAKKVLDNLKAKLPLSLPVFLGSLGMDDFALETAKLLVANGFDTLEKVQAATAEELAALKGMGAIKAKSVVTGLAARSEEIQRLLAVGVVPVAPSAGGGLAGKTFCFTGTLPRPRKEYETLVEKHGGTVLSGVTKELHYLVMSDPSSASTKAEKARKYGTQCIDSDAFMTLVDAASSSAADV